MNQRKFRFNFVDLLILLLAAAMVFVLLYVFVLKDRKSGAEAADIRTVQFVIEVQYVDESLKNAVEKNQPVEDAITKRMIGVVVDSEAIPAYQIGFNKDEQKDVLSQLDGLVHLHITIQSEVYESDRAFSVKDAENVAIRVGEKYSLSFPNFYGSGYCVSMKVMP